MYFVNDFKPSMCIMCNYMELVTFVEKEQETCELKPVPEIESCMKCVHVCGVCVVPDSRGRGFRGLQPPPLPLLLG